MAFSYNYGTYNTWSGAGWKFRAFLAYEVITNNDTTYTIRLNGGAQVDLSNEIGVNGIATTIAGTGQTSKSATINYRNPASTDSARRQTAFSNFTWTWTKGTSSASKTITCTISKSGYLSASTATLNITVPAKTSYTVAYNKNTTDSVSNMPSNQTKWYGTTLTLASNKPTRTGYTFKGWATSASGAVAYQPSGSYTTNAAITLYAVWQINTWTISYNANGGIGSISNQTKTYGQNLTLSNGAGFTKSLYNLDGWNTASDGSGTAYVLGGTYPANEGATLYAQWSLAYVLPVISNFQCYRVSSASSTTETDDGEYIRIAFDYVGGYSGGVQQTPSVKVDISGTTVYDQAMSTTTGTFAQTFGTYSKDNAYTVVVTVYDATYPTGVSKTETINTATYPIDLIGSGQDVFMGIMTPAVVGRTLKIFVDAIYPVGSYYETSDTTFDPNTYFGGTWVLETEGQVHVSAGTGYAVSGALTNTSDGGEETHTLVASEIPSHTHGSVSLNGTLTQRRFGANYQNAYGGGIVTISTSAAGSSAALASQGASYAADRANINATHEHSSVGGDGAHNNMQPYIVVNRWHRTA